MGKKAQSESITLKKEGILECREDLVKKDLLDGLSYKAIGEKYRIGYNTIARISKDLAQWDDEIRAGLKASIDRKLGDLAEMIIGTIKIEDIERLPADKRMIAAGIAIDKAYPSKQAVTVNIAAQTTIDLARDAAPIIDA